MTAQLHTDTIKTEAFDGTLNGYQKAATSTAVYPGQGTFWGLNYVSLKGSGEAGEFNEKVGKLMRDDGLQPTSTVTDIPPEKLTDMIKEIGDELWYVAAKANELGISLEEVARRNIAKLRDRQIRGVLGGSGDNR
jgi:NTP pyrophosphatase (non-canonical NTP hydrolase)